MIVEPGVVQHPKFIQLKTLVGTMAMEYLVRLWGHCQQNKRGQVWRGATPDYVEVVCCGKVNPRRPVFEALQACHWVELLADGVEIHDWDLHNASLKARWLRVNGSAQKPVQGSAQDGVQEGEQAVAQNTTGQDRTGQDTNRSTGGEKKGGGAGCRERQMRTQFAALREEIKGLEGRVDDLTAAEREDLRKKRARLAEIQKKQARGEF
jgi:hypothetical protein